MSDPTPDDTTVVDTPTDTAAVTPVPDEAEPSPFDSADGATSTDSATTASDGTDASGAAPSPEAEEESSPSPAPSSDEPAPAASDTPIYDSIGTDSDTGTSTDTPEPDPQPEADLETGGTYDGTEGTADGGAPAAEPTNPTEEAPTATPIADGKDGAGPTENQPTIDELPSPGVDPDVSLSPTSAGVPDQLGNDDELDTEPVITQPDEQDTPDGLEPTFVTQTTIVAGPVGRTPRFTGKKVGDVVSVRKVDWVGVDTFDIHGDDVDELVGLLEALRDA